MVGIRAAIAPLLAALVGCRPEPPKPPPPQTEAQEPGAAEILAASRLPAELPKPIAGDPMAVTIHRLSNGMTVYISPDPAQPRVTAWIGVRAGARHDPPDSTGLAHYLEHMLFKGTDEIGTLDYAKERELLSEIAQLYADLAEAGASERPKILAAIDKATTASASPAIPGEFERLYGALGIVGINAFTSNDTTVYHCEVPAYQLANWAHVEAERFDDAVFRLFFPELESVYEEKNLALDAPEDIVADAQGDALFPQHPYGQQTIIGEVEHLRNPAFADMVAFFDRWYVPNNMAIVLAGDVEAKKVVPMLDKAFARLKPKQLPARPPGTIVPLGKRVHRVVNAPGEQGVSLTWPTVPATHEDSAGLDVLDMILDNGSTGLIDIELELSQKLPAAGAYALGMAEAGYLELYATAREDQSLDDAEALLVGMTKKLARGEFTDDDVAAVKLQLEVNDAYAFEDPEERADMMMDAFVYGEEWADVLARREVRRSVDRAAVVDLARKYLGDDYVAVHRRDGTPKREKLVQPTVTPIEIDVTRRSVFAGKVAARSGTPPPPRFLEAGRDYTEDMLPGGPVIRARNDRNDLFTLTYAFEHGSRDDPLLCFAFSLFEASGARGRSAEELKRRLYRFGASVDVDCGLDGVEIHIFGIGRFFDPTLDLVEGWLDAPEVERGVLPAMVANALSEREDTMEDPYWVGLALRDYARLGASSPWLKVPTNRELQKARPKALLAKVSALRNLERRTLYFGPPSVVPNPAALRWGGGTKETKPIPPRVLVHPEGPRVLAVHQDTSKARAWVIFGRPPLPATDRANALLFEHYLDGDSTTLVYQELRESRGLVYSSAAWYALPDRPGDESELRGSFATGNDKLVDAAALLLDVLGREPDRDRFREARATLQRRFRLDRTLPRATPYEVAAWQVAGFNADIRAQDWAGISRASAHAVTAFARDQTSEPATLVVVGDLDRIGRDALRRFGTLIELEPDAIFGYGG